MNEIVHEYASRLSKVLAKITKMPELSTGILSDAATLIAQEGCHALDTHRVGIWTTTEEAKVLKSLAYYDINTGKHAVQDDFDLTSRMQYGKLLQSERLIVINDIRSPNVLSDLVDEYGPNICSMLDAPIRIDGKLVGVVCIEQDRCGNYPDYRVWSMEEQHFASSLADFMALALAGAERLFLMRRTKTLMNNLPGMVYQCLNDPPNFTFVFVSDGCMALTGYTPDELMGNSALKFLDMVHPDDVVVLEKLNAETLSIGLPLETTFRIVMKDGSIKWIWERSHVVEKTPNGSPYLLEGFYADITGQRDLEAAEAASRYKSIFLAKMSHEIRTPMNAILGMAELALREEMSDAAREHTLAIKQAGVNLLSIINDILDFSKIEKGQLEVVTEEYILSFLVNDVISIIKMRTLDSQLRFDVNIDGNLPNKLLGDVTRIRQIILNLLNNAVKYTEKGFVSFSVTGKIIDDTVNLIIEVADSGIGIKEENIGKLFGEFTQFDLERNKGIEGTGLGLAISYGLTKAMNGEINVTSEYGKGSSFTVSLPQKFLGSEKLAQIEGLQDKKVLVFERRETCLNSIIRTMDGLNINYKIVSNVSEFNDSLASNQFSFIFVALALYDSVRKKHLEIKSEAKIIVIAEFGEVVTNKNLNIITTPIFSIPVANALNGVSDSYIRAISNESRVRFIAPEARVLVVDDISTNLKVAEGLMLPYKMKIDLRESGRAALDAVKSNHYDLVFMDHMMPGMDGIETAAAIRAWEKKQGENRKQLPIVALTANAVSGTKEMFIKNGFNEFLSKPINIFELNTLLEKWIPREKQQEPVADATAKRNLIINESIEIPGVNTEKGILMSGGSSDNYYNTLAIFNEDCRKKVKEVNICVKENNISLYTIHVHALKSASANIGADDISEVAEVLEAAGQRNDCVFIAMHTHMLITDLERLNNNIDEALLARRGKTKNEPSDMEMLKGILLKLKTAMINYDVPAINETAKKLRPFAHVSGIGDSIGKILQRKLVGEYEEAVELIETMLAGTAFS